MLFSYPPAMRKLIAELTKLPSVGERSAARLSYFLLTEDRAIGDGISHAIREALSKITLCKFCYFLSEEEVCPICRDSKRDTDLLCIVEKPADVFALERSGGYRGLYHVLHGVWSPLKGVRPEDTKINEMLRRLDSKEETDPLQLPLKEIILATSATVEGEATALYIAREIEGLNIVTSRIAQGLPKGAELEFADEFTLNMSIQGRRVI